MKDLGDVFSPISVMMMEPSLLANIAEESEEDQQRRTQLVAKKKSLEKGVEVCEKALRGIRAGTFYIK